MSRLPNGTLPKDQAVREVPTLFPQTRLSVTDDQAMEYSGHLPYAFAIDRQSDKREMLRAQATGCRRRVESILSMAREHRVYLPQPALNVDQEDGELPFFFDTNHWFVDGERKKATGYAASENARPKLWRAFRLAKTLAERGIGPSEFIIGEATRFFRNEQWLTSFVRALWGHGIKIYVCGFAEVNEWTLPGLVAYINALSGWLPQVTRGARDQRKQQKKLFSNQPPFGLLFTGKDGDLLRNDRSEVWTRPDQWSIVSDLLYQLADGRITNATDGAIWLRDIHGIARAPKWIRDLVRHPMLYGEYLAYHRRWEPRKLREPDGLRIDLDIRENGTQRYLVHDQEGLHFDIQYSPGTQAIPPEIAMQALRRIERRRGRPETHPRLKDSILPAGLTRCAVCSCSVREYPPRAKEGTVWRLKCRCIEHFRVSKDMTTAQSRMWIEENKPHVLELHANLSELLWNLITEQLQVNPPSLDEPAPDVRGLIDTARRRLAEAEAEFDAFQMRCLRGDAGDPSNARIKDSIERERTRHLRTLDERETEIKRLTETRVTSLQEQVARKEIGRILMAFHRFGTDVATRREFLSQIVSRIDVHLEERWFKVHIHASLPSLQVIVGRFTQAEGTETDQAVEKEGGCLTTFIFATCLPGTITPAMA